MGKHSRGRSAGLDGKAGTRVSWFSLAGLFFGQHYQDNEDDDDHRGDDDDPTKGSTVKLGPGCLGYHQHDYSPANNDQDCEVDDDHREDDDDLEKVDQT